MIVVMVDTLCWILLLLQPVRRWLPGMQRWWSAACLFWLLIIGLYGLIVAADQVRWQSGTFDGFLNLIWAPRGFFGGFSLSAVLIICELFRQNGDWGALFAARERHWLPLILVAVAVLFYPPALGLGLIDPYAWGYDEALVLPLVVGIAAFGGWLAGWRLSALALVLALVAWRLHLLASTNLWDYLFDPLLVLGASWVLVARALRPTLLRLRARRTPPRIPPVS
ncbi:hypothetical protein AGMMS49960_16920 [Betaproteobacteria bacterium]|nr:hypothetical protein AGMMS49543_00090 [Betaproteobacteria bacterium]GHU03114.1 hypothetical protein AGMMS49960_16920 [Betaproteobacteria bacterium]GHU16227.1 hypothetical protein AGMMS50243_01840 [Betaproteobacteria bacterium]